MTAQAMTEAQFAALAKLLRLRPGTTCEAARLVLVHGRSAQEAAQVVGIEPRLVARTVKRVQDGLEVAMVAAGLCNSGAKS